MTPLPLPFLCLCEKRSDEAISKELFEIATHLSGARNDSSEGARTSSFFSYENVMRQLDLVKDSLALCPEQPLRLPEGGHRRSVICQAWHPLVDAQAIEPCPGVVCKLRKSS